MRAARLAGWVGCGVCVWLACSLAYHIRLYAINTYGTVIHEFGASSCSRFRLPPAARLPARLCAP